MKEIKRPKGEREYKIAKSNLGYNVYRRKEEDWFLYMEWLQKESYTLNKEYARTFYTLEDATNAFIIAKAKWEKRSLTGTNFTKKSGLGEHKEKTSWFEL